MQYEIQRGDCIAKMRATPDNTYDSIVCDPPYELGFMGKTWDASGIAYSVEMWREALRVLKPGGHLLAFSGSRTYHRMTCAIEDAGFEVRDQIFWCYGSGFPKSNNLDNLRGKKICGCSTGALPYTHENTESQTEYDVHSLLDSDVPEAVDHGQGGGQILQQGLPEQSAPGDRATYRAGQHAGAKQSCVEGWRDAVQKEGQLQGHSVRAGTGSAAADGTGGRLRNGAPAGDGAVVRIPADAHGSGSPRRPRSDEQPPQQSGTVADEQRAQAMGAWPVCGGCGLPVVPQGLGTALKPAHEPICVARKPLIGTVAANVLQHGTGALNIDGCRVHAHDSAGYAYTAQRMAPGADQNKTGKTHQDGVEYQGETKDGRWPANLIHDGSDEVLARFPHTKSGALTAAQQVNGGWSGTVNCYGTAETGGTNEYGANSGSAARFFYCAKASKSDRGPNNTHPTVKPLALMQYLVRLVTPPGGHVLDPFAGSGSTIVAALREGFRATGIELLDEHAAIIEGRMDEELYGDIL